jgi:soluble lytic murein transglycosylase
LERFDQQLPANDRTYAWGQVAMAGALRHRPEAVEWFRRAGTSGLTDRQLAWKARSGMRTGDWANVLEAIDAMTERERQLAPWRYWKARGLLALGRAAEGNALLAPLSYEHSFYGHLASEDLGASLSEVPSIYHPSAEDVAGVEQAPGIRRALKFYELGLRYEGALEWRWTVRAFDDRNLLAAAEVARRAGWYERAIDTAEQTKALHDFTLRYPTPYREVVSGYTRQLALDEAWVYGLVRQESRFVVDARSSAGAAGLMQLMPGTARQVARRLGMSALDRQRVTAIDTNISLGTYYLRDLMDSLDNQSVLATAGYNAGPSRARVWRGDTALEGAIYTETIPFNETRDYVRKVMNNTMYYSRLIGQQFTGLRERLGVIAPRPPDNE